MYRAPIGLDNKCRDQATVGRQTPTSKLSKRFSRPLYTRLAMPHLAVFGHVFVCIFDGAKCGLKVKFKVRPVPRKVIILPGKLRQRKLEGGEMVDAAAASISRCTLFRPSKRQSPSMQWLAARKLLMRADLLDPFFANYLLKVGVFAKLVRSTRASSHATRRS